ncbi:MAG: hypothetical protein HAW62_04775 [Endozoicomonadaceae bacterium]|nr:hypothetical protein [Endozoicomonadaceae bacterium]
MFYFFVAKSFAMNPVEKNGKLSSVDPELQSILRISRLSLHQPASIKRTFDSSITQKASDLSTHDTTSDISLETFNRYVKILAIYNELSVKYQEEQISFNIKKLKNIYTGKDTTVIGKKTYMQYRRKYMRNSRKKRSCPSSSGQYLKSIRKGKKLIDHLAC